MVKLSTKKSVDLAQFAQRMMGVYTPEVEHELGLVPSMAIKNLRQSLSSPFVSDSGGLSYNQWRGYLDYRSICLDGIAKKVIHSGHFETYHCAFADLVNPVSTMQLYKMEVVLLGEGTVLSCEVDFRSHCDVSESLELGKDLQCLRVIYDFVYLPCAEMMGEIASVEIGTQTIPLDLFSQLVDPRLSLEERVIIYKGRC